MTRLNYFVAGFCTSTAVGALTSGHYGWAAFSLVLAFSWPFSFKVKEKF